MIYGVVNQSCEATIPLVIINEKRQTKLIDAVIDKVNYLITDDRNLLVLHPFRCIEIITPAAFLEL